MIGLLNAERMKLTSTRSPWWCVAVALLTGIGLPVLICSAAPRREDISQDAALIGCAFALPILWVMAVLAVTTEYRFSTIRSAYSITPTRWPVAVAKTLVLAVLNMIVTWVIVYASLAIGGGIRPLSHVDPSKLYGAGLVAFAGTLLVIGLSFLLRQSAGAISVLLVWMLVLEPMSKLIPNVGDGLNAWMPFTRAIKFSPALLSFVGPPHQAPGPWGSFLYFAGVSLLVWIAGLVVTQKRDA